MVYEIYLGAGRVSINSALSYQSSEILKKGQLVIVPLRDQQVFGVVVQASTVLLKKLKPISQVLPYSLSKQQIELINWLRVYYPSPVSSIVQMFMPPPAITRIVNEHATEPLKMPDNLPKLTAEQRDVIRDVYASQQTNYLLHGRTGSGKTRVYAELAVRTINSGKSVIILTPEIGLTTPLIDYFQTIFGSDGVICFHSQLNALAKATAWADASSDKPKIIIGPRSALFLPVTNVGLVVVDEAHDSAYKQEQQPFYHATRVATKLASIWKAKCVLGSATPLVNDYYAFANKHLPILEMTKLAITSNYTREDNIIDLRDRSLFHRSQLISTPLVNAIENALKAKQQVLLYLNRRGSARTVLCQNCGWQELCPNCDIGLTYHADKNKVLCHACSFQKPVPMQCPECSSNDIIFQTPGTKSVESEISRLFPEANVGRYDKDSATGTKLHQTYSDVLSGKIDILVGTQLLAKGLDLPNLSVIGLLQADSSLMLPDFSATERTFEQISQVAGRLGRGHSSGKLFLQTYQPDKQLLKWALDQDYTAFYKSELAERLQYGFPPASYLLIVQVKRATQAGATKAINRIAGLITVVDGLHVGEPAPCFHEKRSGKYYWQIVIRSRERSKLLEVIKQLPAQTQYNIDPTDLL